MKNFEARERKKEYDKERTQKKRQPSSFIKPKRRGNPNFRDQLAATITEVLT